MKKKLALITVGIFFIAIATGETYRFYVRNTPVKDAIEMCHYNSMWFFKANYDYSADVTYGYKKKVIDINSNNVFNFDWIPYWDEPHITVKLSLPDVQISGHVPDAAPHPYYKLGKTTQIICMFDHKKNKYGNWQPTFFSQMPIVSIEDNTEISPHEYGRYLGWNNAIYFIDQMYKTKKLTEIDPKADIAVKECYSEAKKRVGEYRTKVSYNIVENEQEEINYGLVNGSEATYKVDVVFSYFNKDTLDNGNDRLLGIKRSHCEVAVDMSRSSPLINMLGYDEFDVYPGGLPWIEKAADEEWPENLPFH